MCAYFCIGFIDFVFAGRSLIDFTNLFSPYDFKKNDDIILSYFKLMVKVKREFVYYFLSELGKENNS